MRSILIALLLVTLPFPQLAHAVGIPAGTRLDIVADATYLNAASQTQLAPESVVSVTVSQLAGALIERGPFFGRTVPGQDVYIPLRVRNAGNAEDSFALTVLSAHGWTLDIVYDDNNDGIHQATEQTIVSDTGLVIPDGYSPCFVRVSVPVDATQGDALTFRAVSDADPIRATAQCPINLDAPGALTVSITVPTSDSIYSAPSDTLTIQGTAFSGADVTRVTWANSRGGSGTCTGAAAWSVAGMHMYAGSNVITVTATDSAARTATDTLTVNVPDTTAPVITIASPTDAPSYVSTSRVIPIAGTASDTRGVTSVTWTNDRNGSGTCAGTTTWSATGIILEQGANLITVTARNSSGKTKTDTLSVTYTPEITGPAIIITSPTHSPTYTTTGLAVSLGGVASADDGIASVTWSSSRGGSGECSGTTSWAKAEIELQPGQNVITATVTDTSGATATDTLTVTRSEPQSTAIAITGPTAADSWVTGRQAVTLSGIASSAIGVTSINWSSDKGGSGTCAGTTSWTAADIPLEFGENVITVSASDGSQVLGTDLIRVTYQADTSVPAIDITYPTDQPQFARNCPVLNLAGTASDDTSVAAIRWENAATGASGTGDLADDNTWSADDIELAVGENQIVVSAEDAVGNTVVVGVTVTYVDTLPGDAWLGRAMVSVPIIPDEPDPKEAVGFDDASWCCYVTRANSYSVYPNRATWFDPAEQTPGRGFWATFSQAPTGPYGTIPAQDQPEVITLRAGWNLFGNPYVSDLRWDITQILVQEPGRSPRPLSESHYLVNPYAWGWRQNPDDLMNGDYYLIYDSNLAPGTDDKLIPWRAYWIKADRDCYLILPPPVQSS